MKTKTTTIFASVFAALALSVTGCVGAEPADEGMATFDLRGPSIVDVALEVNGEGSPYEGAFDTLVAALLAADPAVIDTLSSRGQRTVFAPTNDAFAALGLDADNIDTLGEEALTEVLLYHVANGRRYAEDVLESDRIRTIGGGFFFSNGDGTLTDANDRTGSIIVTDVEAANGVIHAIDFVLLP